MWLAERLTEHPKAQRSLIAEVLNIMAWTNCTRQKAGYKPLVFVWFCENPLVESSGWIPWPNPQAESSRISRPANFSPVKTSFRQKVFIPSELKAFHWNFRALRQQLRWPLTSMEVSTKSFDWKISRNRTRWTHWRVFARVSEVGDFKTHRNRAPTKSPVEKFSSFSNFTRCQNVCSVGLQSLKFKVCKLGPTSSKWQSRTASSTLPSNAIIWSSVGHAFLRLCS